LFLFLFSSSFIQANISVTIVSNPDSALLYTPVYVTLLLRNDGPGLILAPVNDDPRRGIGIEISTPNGYLAITPDSFSKRFGDDVRWLKTNGEFLFQYEISEKLPAEGIYEIRAAYRGDGVCRILKGQLSEFQLKPIPSKADEYDCFKGNAFSETKKILIYKPVNHDDMKILEEVISGRWRTALRNWDNSDVRRKLVDAFPHLIEEYPNSTYTYAAGLYSASSSMWGCPYETLEKIMALQPNHPLTIYAQMKWRLSVFWEARDKEYGSGARDRIATKGMTKLPGVLEQFVSQREAEINSQPYPGQ